MLTELERELGPRSRRQVADLETRSLLRGEHDRLGALSSSTRAPAAPSRRTGPRCCCACTSAGRSAAATPIAAARLPGGRRGGHQGRHARGRRRVRLRLPARPRPASTGWCASRRSTRRKRRHTSFASVLVLPHDRRHDQGRHRARRPARSTRSAPAARAASTSTRPSRRCASRTCPPALVVAVAGRAQPAPQHATCAMKILMSRLFVHCREPRSAPRPRRWPAPRRTSTSAARSARTCCSPTPWSNDHRTETEIARRARACSTATSTRSSTPGSRASTKKSRVSSARSIPATSSASTTSAACTRPSSRTTTAEAVGARSRPACAPRRRRRIGAARWRRDVRPSSERLARAAERGMIERRARGRARRRRAHAGALLRGGRARLGRRACMITGSRNPPEFNGFKMTEAEAAAVRRRDPRACAARSRPASWRPRRRRLVDRRARCSTRTARC